MLILDKMIKLKDGRTAILRSPREEDAAQLLEFLRITAGETDFLLRMPEECDLTEEQERDWIRGCRESEYVCAIVCEVDGEIAGNCEVRFNKRLKIRHRSNVGIGLKRRFWNLGIGTAMFEELIRVVREKEGVTQMELEFAQGNERGRALYEKMGFRVIGCRPDAFRLKDGTMLDEYMMLKVL